MHWKNWMTALSSNLFPLTRRNAKRKDWQTRLHIDILEERTVPTASLRLAAMGDSITASYAGSLGRSDDLSWTQQLEQQHPSKLELFNVAVAGATSSDVLFGGQAESVHDLVAAGDVDYVTLIVGANDLEAELYADLPILLGGNPALFYQTFVTNYTTTIASNIQGTLDFVSSAGNVGWVISNIPDVTITPAYAGADPFILFTLHDAVVSANAQIESIATARGIPMIDFYELSHLGQTPLSIGRVSISNFYAADGFHPNTVAQGVLANTILNAVETAYDAPVKKLVMTDQQILSNADISYPHRWPTYFDVTSYVIFQGSSESVTWCTTGQRWDHPQSNTRPGQRKHFEHDRHGDRGDEHDWFVSRTGLFKASIGKRSA